MTEPSNSEAKSGTKSEAKGEIKKDTKLTSKENQSKSSEPPVKGRSKTIGGEQPARKSQRKVAKPAKSESHKVASRRTSPFLWMLALTNFILLIIVSLAGGYFWYSTKQSESQQLANLQQSLDTASQSIASQNKAVINSLKQQIQSQNSQLFADINKQKSILEQQVESIRSEVDEVAGNRDDDLLNTEVEYLIRMATRKVVIEQNTEQASYLLSEAGQLLNAIADPKSFRLRELIAQDLNQLKVKQLENNDELLLKLNTIMAASQNLAFAKPDQVYGKPHQKPSEDIADWAENLGITWNNIKDAFLDWEVLEQPFKPYLNLQQQEIVRGMVQYHILAARHAVLSRNSSLYFGAIAQVEALLPNFDPETGQVQVVKQQLERLRLLPLKEEVSLSLASYEYLTSGETSVAPSSGQVKEVSGESL